MDVSAEHIEYALEPIKYLSKPQVGGELYDTAIKLCREKKFEESIQFCNELYQLGLKLSETYVQGVAKFCLGSVYFALGEPNGNWDRAAECYRQSAGLFHTFFNAGCERNEAIAELAIGRLYEKQCAVLSRDRWPDAITAYEKSKKLFCDENDPLADIAQESLHRVTENYGQWLNGQVQKPPVPPDPVSASPPVQPTGVVESNMLSQLAKKKEDKSAMGTNAPKVSTGNYAVKVICLEEGANKRKRRIPFLRLLLGLGLVLLAIAEAAGALWLLRDWQAQLIIIAMFAVTVLIFVALLFWWWLRIRVGAGSIGIVTGGAQPQLIQPGAFWLAPFSERLFDLVPTQPMLHNWRVEFRGQEMAAVPDIYQEVMIQYQVAQGDPLRLAVLNQLALGGVNSRHPMGEYWRKQICNGLQRYFEDLPPDQVPAMIRNSQTNEIENKIQTRLQGLSNNQGWGIQFTDVHTRHYQFKD